MGGAALGPTGLFAAMNLVLQLAFPGGNWNRLLSVVVRWLLEASRSVAFLLNELRDGLFLLKAM